MTTETRTVTFRKLRPEEVPDDGSSVLCWQFVEKGHPWERLAGERSKSGKTYKLRDSISRQFGHRWRFANYPLWVVARDGGA